MKLDKTEHYFNTQTGDIFSVNWTENIPNAKDGWVRISDECYNVLTKHIFGDVDNEVS